MFQFIKKTLSRMIRFNSNNQQYTDAFKRLNNVNAININSINPYNYSIPIDIKSAITDLRRNLEHAQFNQPKQIGGIPLNYVLSQSVYDYIVTGSSTIFFDTKTFDFVTSANENTISQTIIYNNLVTLAEYPNEIQKLKEIEKAQLDNSVYEYSIRNRVFLTREFTKNAPQEKNEESEYDNNLLKLGVGERPNFAPSVAKSDNLFLKNIISNYKASSIADLEYFCENTIIPVINLFVFQLNILFKNIFNENITLKEGSVWRVVVNQQAEKQALWQAVAPELSTKTKKRLARIDDEDVDNNEQHKDIIDDTRTIFNKTKNIN